jgi:hypothetical protein
VAALFAAMRQAALCVNRFKNEFSSEAANAGISKNSARQLLRGTLPTDLSGGAKRAWDRYQSRVGGLTRAKNAFKDLANGITRAHEAFIPADHRELLDSAKRNPADRRIF